MTTQSVAELRPQSPGDEMQAIQQMAYECEALVATVRAVLMSNDQEIVGEQRACDLGMVLTVAEERAGEIARRTDSVLWRDAAVRDFSEG